MLKAAVGVLSMGFAAMTWGAAPIIDNEHVTVWDTEVPLSAALHDFIAVPLSRKGSATFGRHGERPGSTGSRTIVIELKNLPVTRLVNDSGYQLAFPRKRAKKLLENAQVVVWDYVWRPGEPTPMHFHDKDAVVVFEATGALQSTTPDGKSAISEFKPGEARFSARGRTHSEILADGEAHAVVTELK